MASFTRTIFRNFAKMEYKMKTVVSIIFILIVLMSCKKKESEQPLPEAGSDEGFFVVNEGNYTWGNASLSFYNYRTGLIENQVFYRVNNIPLGDVALHMQIYKNKGFIVVNNSGKIYVINPFTFQYLGSIQGFTSPRNLIIYFNGNYTYNVAEATLS